MKIAIYGWKFIGIGLAAAAAGAALWRLKGCGSGLGLGLLGLVFAGFCAYFFRDPDRALPTDASRLYSPGDGVVMSVAREGPGPVTTIRVFLSIFDVHVQRFPCSGTVRKMQYVEGSFVAAMKQPESFRNERNVVSIDCGGRTVVVEQIAGLIARRIVFKKKPGDSVLRGERVGMIRFGSRVDLLLPAEARLRVRLGERVQGGSSVIAELP